MNHPSFLSGYTAFHLPLHLPEIYWILEQNFDRLGLKAPESILDLGSGPGTLTLSALLWAKAKKIAQPKDVYLVDLSKKALEWSSRFIASITDKDKTKVHTRRANLQDKYALPPKMKADWVFMGHILNEWGSGPRMRDRKLDFVLKILRDHVKPGGYLFIVEPPLREPTHDLMWIRDELSSNDDEKIVAAPCPGGVRFCPMIRNKMGWCYAQPPRTWARELGLTPWDAEIRGTLNIRLEDPGFSYLILRAATHDAADAAQDFPSTHSIGITDNETTRQMACSKTGVKVTPVPYRGAYIAKTLK